MAAALYGQSFGRFSNRLYLEIPGIPLDANKQELKCLGVRCYSDRIGNLLSIIGFAVKIKFSDGKSFYVNSNSLAQWEFRNISYFLDSKPLSGKTMPEIYDDYKKNGYDREIIRAIKNQFNRQILNLETIKQFDDSFKTIIEACRKIDNESEVISLLYDCIKVNKCILMYVFRYIDRVQLTIKPHVYKPIFIEPDAKPEVSTPALNNNEKILVLKHLNAVFIKKIDEDKSINDLKRKQMKQNLQYSIDVYIDKQGLWSSQK